MDRNRRKFSRIPFQTEASLFLPDGEYVVEVLDLSLKGALIHPNSEMFVTVGTNCTLKIRLDQAGAMIRMEATVVHHLPRLVELNLGDEAMAEREFSLLSLH